MALHLPLIKVFPRLADGVVTSSNQQLEYKFWYGGNGRNAVSGLTA